MLQPSTPPVAGFSRRVLCWTSLVLPPSPPQRSPHLPLETLHLSCPFSVCLVLILPPSPLVYSSIVRFAKEVTSSGTSIQCLLCAECPACPQLIIITHSWRPVGLSCHAQFLQSCRLGALTPFILATRDCESVARRYLCRYYLA